MSKLFFFDLETTGVKFWENGIHQISGLIEINGEIKETFDFKVQPENCVIEKEALEVGGVSLEQLRTYPSMASTYNTLIKLLSKYISKYDKSDKFFLVGYNNASFDNQFFRAFFEQNDDKYFGSWFWANSIDVMVLATYHLRQQRTSMKDFKLKTVAQAFGLKIDEERLHDASYDIELTYKIYKSINRRRA